jgi:hypothetical protein
MSTTPWSDDDLRRHVLSTGGMFAALDAAAAERTAECTRQMTRIVPAVQRRLLESTGAVTSPEGVAILAAEVIDRSPDPRRYWLVASTTPWQHLEEWVGDELVRIYKRAAKRGKDKEALAGIEAASTRRELE